jgi:hypothetical protein
MNKKFYILIIILSVFLSASCSLLKKEGETTEATEEIVFDDGYKTSEGEIIFDDKNFQGGEQPIATSSDGSQEATATLGDNSQLTTMIDGHGNKTETRVFNTHPRLRMVLLRTFANGQKQVFIYGQNGEVKELPENMLDGVINRQADEIANSAGLFESVQQRQLPMVVVNRPANLQPLQPMPSYKFPIQTQQAEEAPQEPAQSESDSAENAARQNGGQIAQRREAASQNQQPE